MPRSERMGQLIGIFFIMAFLAYFAALRTESTGFFTSEFTALGAFMFFGGGAYGIVPTLIRFMTGRKNPARLLDASGSMFIAVASAYLLIVFPLEFSHLGDLLPNALESLVEVITNDIARILLTIATVASPVIGFYNIILYIAVRKKLSAQSAPSAGQER